jgi:predicted DNA-binding transcriptional regulator AlpA
MAEGAFPRPVALHGVRKAWIESEVSAWVTTRIAARNGEAMESASSKLAT